MAHELPPATRRFLQTPDGRRARAIVHAFHRWLDRQRMTVVELTPTLIGQFFARPRQARVSTRTRARYRERVHNYIRWLHHRALIAFDPRHLRRHPYPLPALAREFLAAIAPTHRPGTCSGYASALRTFYGWLDPRGLDPQRMTRRDLAPWFQELHATGLRPVTRRHILTDVRAYLRWLGDHQRMRTASDELIRRGDFPSLPQYLPRPLPAEVDRELQRRLDSSKDPGAWALLLMRRTGLRIGELRGLERDCVRWDHRHPLLKVPLGKLHNERLVPLDPTSIELIRRLQSLAPRARPWLVPGARPGRPPWSYYRLEGILKACSHDLPDPDRITSHRLRHTYATELLSAGMSLPSVMRLLGHRDYRMTLRYTAITSETVRGEYTKALAQLATKYRLPLPSRHTHTSDPDPSDLLDDLARWLRKHVPAGPPRHTWLKRIDRLKHELRHLRSSTKP
jgi:site-specific recombinase XerD